MKMISRFALLSILAFLKGSFVAAVKAESYPEKLRSNSNFKEKFIKEKLKIKELRSKGFNEVGHSEEAAAMRNFMLRKKKLKGILRKKETSLAEVLFPGVTAENYKINAPIPIYTDTVNSKKTHIPFEFYNLAFCPYDSSKMDHRRKRRNLGSLLQGAEMKPAPYPLHIGQSHKCKELCKVTMNTRDIYLMQKLVLRHYRVHFTLDQLPVLMRSSELNYAVRGYPIGFASPSGAGKYATFLYNHLKFVITYESVESDSFRITGFDVIPVSKKHTDGTCDGSKLVINQPATYQPLSVEAGKKELEITYSYEVEWKESSLPWSDRWDVYLIGSPDDDVHFFAILNSLMIVIFLTGSIATIMIRNLRRDIAGYNEMVNTLEDTQEETGWKLVHADVFRPPSTCPMQLCVLVGTGSQIGIALILSMLLSSVKLLNPLHKGQTLTAVIILYALCGSVAGYISARLHKVCNAQDWKLNTFYTACGLPSVLAGIFCILNIFLSFAGASTAVSFLTILMLFSLWIFVSAPLVFVGAYFGYKAEKIHLPTKVTRISRQVPEVPLYLQMPYSALLGGILPFGSVCIELFFVMSALWLHQIYYVMGFLFVILLILCATCAEIAIVSCYLQLCSEDHRWWWKSFWNCASFGFYLLLYSMWFLRSSLKLVGILPLVVYMTYMSMISLCLGLFCGAVGLLASFWFNKTIYGALKVD